MIIKALSWMSYHYSFIHGNNLVTFPYIHKVYTQKYKGGFEMQSVDCRLFSAMNSNKSVLAVLSGQNRKVQEFLARVIFNILLVLLISEVGRYAVVHIVTLFYWIPSGSKTGKMCYERSVSITFMVHVLQLMHDPASCAWPCIAVSYH